MSPKTLALRISGFTALALGIIGIPLPILPTTPFLLLALYCFARSSPRMQKWLIEHKVLGQYISSYRSEAGVPVKVKVITLLVMWAAMIFSMVWATDKLWLRLLLLGIAIGVSIHIIRLKGVKKQTANNNEQ